MGAVGGVAILGGNFEAATFPEDKVVQRSLTAGTQESSAIDAVILDALPLGAPGQLDSHAFLWKGHSHNGSPHTIDWKAFVNVTADDGTGSLWTLQTRIDGAPYTDILTIDDNGLLTVSGATFTMDQLIIDSDNTEAVLIRKDGDAGDVFIVDTVNDVVRMGSDDTLFTFGAASDVVLRRDGTAGILALVDPGANVVQQELRIYSFDDGISTRYLQLIADNTGNGEVLIKANRAAGGGQYDFRFDVSVGRLAFHNEGVQRWNIQGSVTGDFEFAPFITDRYDLGSASFAVRNLFTNGVLIGQDQTAAYDAIIIDATDLTGDGQQDSGAIIWTGLGFETATPHDIDWKAFVDVTANDGTSSIWTLQTRVDAGGFVDRLTIANASLTLGLPDDLAAIHLGASGDAQIHRGDAADILEQRRGLNPQEWRLYDRFVSFADFDRLAVYIGGGPPLKTIEFVAETSNASQGINIDIEALPGGSSDGRVRLITGTTAFLVEPSRFAMNKVFNISTASSSSLTMNGFISSLGFGFAPGVAINIDVFGSSQNSHSINMIGSGELGNRATWKTFVDVINVGANSIWTLQNDLNGGGFNDVLTASDAGLVSLPVSGSALAFGPSPAQSGTIRLGNTDSLTIRNAANSEDVLILSSPMSDEIELFDNANIPRVRFKNVRTNFDGRVEIATTPSTGQLVVGANDLLVDTTNNLVTVSNLAVAGTLTTQGAFIIDITDIEAFLVRQNGDTGDVFIIDTTNEIVKLAQDDTVLAWGAASDVQLHRGDGADILEQRRGANDQRFHLYDNFVSNADYDRLAFYIGGGPPVITAEIAAETTDGSQRIDMVVESAGGDSNMTFKVGSTNEIRLVAAGIPTMRFTPTESWDIGLSTTVQPRDLHLSRRLQIGLTNQTAVPDAIILSSGGVASPPGTLDSHGIEWTGHSNDGSNHPIDFRTFVNVVNNDGSSSIMKFQSQVDTAGFADIVHMVDGGRFAIVQPEQVSIGSATFLDNIQVNITGSFIDDYGGGPTETHKFKIQGAQFADAGRTTRQTIFDVGGAIVTGNNSDTINEVGQAHITSPGITQGTDTINIAYTLKVNNTPTLSGAENYGLLVDSNSGIGPSPGAVLVRIGRDTAIGMKLMVSGGAGIAANFDANAQMRLTSTFVPQQGAADFGVLLHVQSRLTAPTGTTDHISGAFFQGALRTQTAAESVADISQVRIAEPDITDFLTGGGLITNAQSLLITGAPTEGVDNYAFRIASGDIQVGNSSAFLMRNAANNGDLNIWSSPQSNEIDFGDAANPVINVLGALMDTLRIRVLVTNASAFSVGNASNAQMLHVDTSNNILTVAQGVQTTGGPTSVDRLILDAVDLASDSTRGFSHSFLIVGKSQTAGSVDHDSNWRMFVGPRADTAFDGQSHFFLTAQIDSGSTIGIARFSNEGRFAIDRPEQVSFGSATFFDNAHVNITGAFIDDYGGGATETVKLFVQGSITGDATRTEGLFGAHIKAIIITQTATESIADIAQVRIDEPNIVDNLTGDITNAQSLLITGAPTEGVNNYALRIVGGDLQVASSSAILFRNNSNSLDLTALSNAPTDFLEIGGVGGGDWERVNIYSLGRISLLPTDQVQVITDNTTLIDVRSATPNEALFTVTRTQTRAVGQLVSAANLADHAAETQIQTTFIDVATSAGSSVTAASLIPAGSFVIGITVRVISSVGGPASFDVGDGIDVDRWGASIASGIGTTTDITDYTSGAVTTFPAANDVVITSTGVDFTSGTIRITVHYTTLLTSAA